MFQSRGLGTKPISWMLPEAFSRSPLSAALKCSLVSLKSPMGGIMTMSGVFFFISTAITSSVFSTATTKFRFFSTWNDQRFPDIRFIRYLPAKSISYQMKYADEGKTYCFSWSVPFPINKQSKWLLQLQLMSIHMLITHIQKPQQEASLLLPQLQSSLATLLNPAC